MPPENQLTIMQAMQLATQLHQAGNLPRAEQIYRQILSAQPNHSDAMHQLGVLCFQANHAQQAADLISRAASIQSGNAVYLCNLGRVLAHLDRLQDAIAALARAVQLQPDYAEAWNNLGNTSAMAELYPKAIDAFQRALSLRPGDVGTILNLANAFRGDGQFESAIATARQAQARSPDDPAILNALGHILEEAGDHDQALELLDRAIQATPNFAEAHLNRATTLTSLSRYDESMSAARAAISIDPNNAIAHCNLALTLLLQGTFGQGWAECEWRNDLPAGRAYRRKFPQPQWDGSPLDGKSILVCAEQGFGDTIQFIRYIPLIAQRGGKVIVVCPQELHRLFQHIPEIRSLYRPGDPLPAIDVQIRMMSLPRLFHLDASPIPACGPYLLADPRRSQHWKQRLSGLGNSRKIGLVWAGRAERRYRSMQLEDLAPLAEVKNAEFFSLQKGPAAEAINENRHGFPIHDFTAELTDFAETAALIDHLDLVMTVDTAVAHLAGAMGKPTWIILPSAPDWRWQLQRTDSIWYPAAKLFRQPTRNDWAMPVREIVRELNRL